MVTNAQLTKNIRCIHRLYFYLDEEHDDLLWHKDGDSDDDSGIRKDEFRGQEKRILSLDAVIKFINMPPESDDVEERVRK